MFYLLKYEKVLAANIQDDLEQFGLQVTVCHSREEALEILNKDKNYHAIFTDNVMPKMSGLELIETLSKNDQYKHLFKVLFTGGSITDLNSDKDGKPIADAFLIKPIDMTELAIAVNRASKRALSG